MNAPLQDHYSPERLLEAIETGLREIGRSPETVTVDDLGPADEFHIGGREATIVLFEGIPIRSEDHLLDVGCGLGGTARYLASRFGCHVTGIDLTQRFVDAGQVLNRWVELGDRISLAHGDATGTPFEDASFDGSCMLHVGMNIPDKPALFRELFRLVRPGGWLAVYDILQLGAGEVVFPVPWAASAEMSHLASEDAYRAAIEGAGFRVDAVENRHAYAVDFFERVRARQVTSGPPPIGLHNHMGATTALKFRNLIQALKEGAVAPVTIRAVKPAH